MSHSLSCSIATLIIIYGISTGRAEEPLTVPNGGFEVTSKTSVLPEGWNQSIGKGTNATIGVDHSVAHSGAQSLRMSDQSPSAPYIFAQCASPRMAVEPSTTYTIRCFAKGNKLGKCYVGATFDTGGKQRQTLPIGTYDWQEIISQVTTPADCKKMSIHFATDGICDDLWIDDVSLSRAPMQFANLAEPRYEKTFSGMFPRTPGPLPENLVVADATASEANSMLLVALQGIVNRRGPRLYLINRANPAYYDEVWLRYMQEKGYTGREQRIDNPKAVIERFRDEITGLIVFDPDLPGSLNAAWMLAGIKNALPASPETAAKLDLPVVEDLRGRWKRNVEAYRYIYENYWDQMCHHVLAWEYPRRWQENASRDYQVQWKIFCFWVSEYSDAERGADPPAEQQFLNELLAATPGNVPVMGWMKLNHKVGVEEYTGGRLLAEYGKWIPGTGFNSNVSVHSAIHPPDGVLRRGSRPKTPQSKLEKNKIYVSVNVLDSGDAQWYWQLYQRKIWADPIRGIVPIGYCMNVSICETMPLVAQWYFENATPNDTLFCYLYTHASVYGTRFRQQDRDRIWQQYVQYHADYCRKMDLDGIELYSGAGGKTTDDSVLRRFTQGMSKLDYILADLGRHDDVKPSTANYLLDKTVVFHTLTHFHVWGSTVDVENKSMAQENAWLLDEIKTDSPTARPGFMSVQAASWYYFPTWFKDLQEKLPPQYVLVSPGELARLYREHQSQIGSGVQAKQ